MYNISTLHLRLCVICVVTWGKVMWLSRYQGEYICDVKGWQRRSRCTFQLLLRFMTFSAHFPSSANIRLNISCQWSNHRGRFRFFARPLSTLYRESAQFAPSGRPSWTEKSLTATGEEVDERMDRWEKWCQWQARPSVTAVSGYYPLTEQSWTKYTCISKLSKNARWYQISVLVKISWGESHNDYFCTAA